MDKKKKIIIGSIVATVFFIGIIAVGMSGKKEIESGDENENSQITDSNNQSDTTSSQGDSDEEQPEIKPALGSNFDEFEKNIQDTGFSYFDERCYDLFENDKSIALIQILDNEVIININDRENIANDSIKKVIELLIPNENKEIYNQIEAGVESIAMVLDNRTVMIERKQDEIKLTFTK